MDSLSIRFDNDDVQTWVRKTEIMHHRQLAVSLFASPWGIGLAYILLLYSCCMMFSYALFDLVSFLMSNGMLMGWVGSELLLLLYALGCEAFPLAGGHE